MQQAPPRGSLRWAARARPPQALGQDPPAPGKMAAPAQSRPPDTSVSPRSHSEQKWEELLWKAPLGTVLSL